MEKRPGSPRPSLPSTGGRVARGGVPRCSAVAKLHPESYSPGMAGTRPTEMPCDARANPGPSPRRPKRPRRYIGWAVGRQAARRGRPERLAEGFRPAPHGRPEGRQWLRARPNCPVLQRRIWGPARPKGQEGGRADGPCRPRRVGGQQLARLLREEAPALKATYMSDSSAEMAGRELNSPRGENFLQKPFPEDRLLETLRQTGCREKTA